MYFRRRIAGSLVAHLPTPVGGHRAVDLRFRRIVTLGSYERRPTATERQEPVGQTAVARAADGPAIDHGQSGRFRCPAAVAVSYDNRLIETDVEVVDFSS